MNSQSLDGSQGASGVLLVRPANFAHNPQTSDSNRFQQAGAQRASTADIARMEFDVLVSALTGAGVRVCVVEDTPDPIKPDAVFPNNWVSFHRDGTVVLYPMLAPNRRLERRSRVLASVQERLGFRRRRLIDLSGYEQAGQYLEGTGSLVLDHLQRVAYACRSARTDESLAQEWSRQLDYEPVLFDARGVDGAAIYHTNVLMSVGSAWALVCTEVIVEADRRRVLERLGQERSLIEISARLMSQFAANILELHSTAAGAPPRRLLVLSQRAQAALQRESPAGWEQLASGVDEILAAAVPTIEDVGGGGVRCMLAEVPEVRE